MTGSSSSRSATAGPGGIARAPGSDERLGPPSRDLPLRLGGQGFAGPIGIAEGFLRRGHYDRVLASEAESGQLLGGGEGILSPVGHRIPVLGELVDGDFVLIDVVRRHQNPVRGAFEGRPAVPSHHVGAAGNQNHGHAVPLTHDPRRPAGGVLGRVGSGGEPRGQHPDDRLGFNGRFGLWFRFRFWWRRDDFRFHLGDGRARCGSRRRVVASRSEAGDVDERRLPLSQAVEGGSGLDGGLGVGIAVNDALKLHSGQIDVQGRSGSNEKVPGGVFVPAIASDRGGGGRWREHLGGVDDVKPLLISPSAASHRANDHEDGQQDGGNGHDAEDEPDPISGVDGVERRGRLDHRSVLAVSGVGGRRGSGGRPLPAGSFREGRDGASSAWDCSSASASESGADREIRGSGLGADKGRRCEEEGGASSSSSSGTGGGADPGPEGPVVGRARSYSDEEEVGSAISDRSRGCDGPTGGPQPVAPM